MYVHSLHIGSYCTLCHILNVGTLLHVCSCECWFTNNSVFRVHVLTLGTLFLYELIQAKRIFARWALGPVCLEYLLPVRQHRGTSSTVAYSYGGGGLKSLAALVAAPRVLHRLGLFTFKVD